MNYTWLAMALMDLARVTAAGGLWMGTVPVKNYKSQVVGWTLDKFACRAHTRYPISYFILKSKNVTVQILACYYPLRSRLSLRSRQKCLSGMVVIDPFVSCV